MVIVRKYPKTGIYVMFLHDNKGRIGRFFACFSKGLDKIEQTSVIAQHSINLNISVEIFLTETKKLYLFTTMLIKLT